MPWRAPRQARCFYSTLLQLDFLRGVGRRLHSVSIRDVLPELGDTTWAMLGTPWSIEAPYLCGAARAIDAHNVLEIGTYIGSTTIQLAANIPDTGRIYTVDIDPADAAHLNGHLSRYDRQLVAKQHAQIGSVFREHPLASRICQIIGDSARIDYRQYVDHFDLAYIDGGHSYTQVRGDTEAVLPLMRPGGVVFWHDYEPLCPGVVHYLHELSRTLPVRHIKGTQLAVVRLPK